MYRLIVIVYINIVSKVVSIHGPYTVNGSSEKAALIACDTSNILSTHFCCVLRTRLIYFHNVSTKHYEHTIKTF